MTSRPQCPEVEQDLGSLLHRAFRRLRHSWAAQLAPWDLTPFQWRALNTLTRADDGMRLKDLAEQLRIAPRSATEVVDQLEAAAWVERRADPVDRRAILVSPTERGRERAASVRAERQELSEEYFAVLTPEQRDELADLLGILAAPPAEES